jgi:hypothetical protein
MENRDANLKKLEPLRTHFPKFHAKLCAEAVKEGNINQAEYILTPASDDEIQKIEQRIGVPLPKSYKQFLRCTRGGIYLEKVPTEFNRGQPFILEHPLFKNKICVAEYFLEADGDQIYLDARQGLINDEYPVLYYAHDYAPEPHCFRKVAESFGEWLESL